MLPRRAETSWPEQAGLAPLLRRRYGPALQVAAHRLSRLRASPHEIALGCALGAFVSVTPLLGVQTLLAIALAALLRASIPAAVIGTFFGNPLSWPLIWVSTYAMGLQMTGIEAAFDPAGIERNAMLTWHALVERSPQVLDVAGALLWPLLVPMLAGSLPLGLLVAAVVYYIARHVVSAWRLRRSGATAE